MSKALPPTFFALCIVAIVALHFIAPVRQIVRFPWQLLGLLPIVMGVAVNVISDGQFKHMGTTIKPFEQSSTLVTGGPFRFSRNPMYLGLIFIVGGIALIAGTLTPWIPVVLFAVVLDRRFIQTEEAMLADAFGDEFRTYKRRVRRWLCVAVATTAAAPLSPDGALGSSVADRLQSAYRSGHLDLTVDCVFGGEDAPEEEQVLFQAFHFDVGPGGDVFVSEYKLHCIKRYDAGCDGVTTIGIEGGGPGDFRRPTALSVAPSGNLLVADSGNRRLQRVAPDGTHILTAQYTDWVQEFAFGARGEIYARTQVFEMGVTDEYSTLRIVRLADDLSESAVIDSFVTRNHVVYRYEDGYTVTSAPFYPTLQFAALPDGRLVVGHADESAFRILSPTGKTLRTVETPTPAPEVTDEDRSAFLGRFEPDPSPQTRELIKHIEFPRHKPFYEDIVVDAAGNILVRVTAPEGDDAAFDVFDSDGEFIAHVTMGDLPDRLCFRADYAYGLHFSQEELPTITRYTIDALATDP